MKRINRILNLTLLLMAIVGLVACNDDYSSDHTPVIEAEPLTFEAIRGSWTIDADGVQQKNYATLLYEFKDSASSVRATVLDVDSGRILDQTSAITSVQILKDYLPEPNANGHREALRITFENDDQERIFLVDGFCHDTLKLYLSIDTDDGSNKMPFVLVRKEAKGNLAQPVNMSQAEIDSLRSVGRPPLFQSDGRKNWMARVDGRMLLCDMAIPGTHDSGTSTVDYLSEFAALTQKLNISEQWDAGIRAFDLRVRNYDKVEGKVELCHGPMSCNINFHDVLKNIIRKVKGTKECAILFINTEGNDLASIVDGVPTAVLDAIRFLFLNKVIDVRTDKLDEALTRERVNQIIQNNLDPSMLCLYHPDLTLEEARGKIIIFNRMPRDYKEKGYPYTGQVIVRDSTIEHPDSKYSIASGIKENKWYFAFPDDFKDNDAFDETRKAEYNAIAERANCQLENGNTNILFCNNPSSSYPETIFGYNTVLCDYSAAAHNLYPEFIKKNEKLRSCGIFRQDYAGKDAVTHVSMQAEVNIAIAGFPATTSAAILYGLVHAYELAKPSTEVYGDKMIKSVIDMNFLDRPLRSVSVNKTYIEEKKGYKDTLRLLLYPRDANKNREVVSWVSDNTQVATIDKDGHLKIVGYGNAILTVTMQNGAKAVTYVCCRPNPVRSLDLGLSVKWADRNFGASVPANEGVPFAWGDPTLTYSYSLGQYMWAQDGQMTKYNNVDRRLTLDISDDVVRQHMGGKWRMPTRAEVEELIAKSKISQVTLDNGVHALQFERNGVKMVLPETTYRDATGPGRFNTPGGYLWTSTICQDATTHAANWNQAYCIRLEMDKAYHIGLMNFNRYYAMPIRPVQER